MLLNRDRADLRRAAQVATGIEMANSKSPNKAWLEATTDSPEEAEIALAKHTLASQTGSPNAG